MRRIDRPAKVDLVNYEPEDAYMFDMRSPLVTCNRERKRERERDVFRTASELDSNYIEIMQERGKEKKRERARER